MRLVPTFDDIADAQNAINAQHPSLSDDAPATTLANETDGTGRRVVRLTTQQLATIVHGLAIATTVERVKASTALTAAAEAGTVVDRTRELELALAAGVRLFQQTAREARLREVSFDLEDPVSPETWKAIAEWQTLATTLCEGRS